MDKDTKILMSHLLDLANAAYYKNRVHYSNFLNLNEQTLLQQMQKDLPDIEICLDGGYPYAERKLVCFKPLGVGMTNPTPLCLLRITPVNSRFAEDLNHRDFLGALLNLGIERPLLGDILIESKSAQVFCIPTIADLICDELIRVKHTQVRGEKADGLTDVIAPATKVMTGSVASPRLDAIIGLAFRQSRSKLAGLIAGEKVYVNSRLITSNSYLLKENDVVSVRGYGKFIYDGTGAQSKKGRYFVSLRIFC